jgi:subtilisin family serine protease
MRRLVLFLACALLLVAPAVALAVPDPLAGRQWNLAMVESTAAHRVATGSGATIAVIDTGIHAGHPDLQGSRFRQGFDFAENDPIPQDGNGHGTHVIGIAGANEANGIGVASLAPEATILPVKVLGNDGSGDVADVVRGIDFAVAQGADIINLSLGSELPLVGTPGEFNDAIDRALDAGRIVVAAAGNDALPACGQPSGQGRLLCVGAVDRRRARSPFSNYGVGLGLVAPGGSGQAVFGENVLSTFNGGSYGEVAGTSQAAPHVSGVAALLVQKGLRGQAAVQRILASATDVGAGGPDIVYGAGIVDARAALGIAAGGTLTPPPPAAAAPQVVVSLARRARIRTVLKRGIRVRCRAAGAGRCRVGAYRGPRRLAAGSARLVIGRSAVAVARFNKQGRAGLLSAFRRKKRVAMRVRVTLPGARAQNRRITLVP